MNSTTHEPLNLPGEELAILAEMLEMARAKLLIEIRHTDHRAFRNELRHRLTLVESLMEHGEALPTEPADQVQVSGEPQVAVVV